MPRTSVGCHGWCHGVCHGQNRDTCRGHNRGICRGSAMSRGPCRGNPRISTVARGNTHGSPRKCRGYCRGPPPKSQIMCIRASVRIVHPLRTPDLEVTGTSVERDYVGSGSRRASSLSLETGSSRSIVICWQSYNMTRYTRFRAALTDRWR